MIIVRNRELLIPRNEAFIGTKFDVDAENRYFKIDRMLPSQIDLSGFTFALDVKYADGTSDTLSATKDITDDSLVLKVSFSSSMPVGDMRIQLRASDVSGRRWSSAEAVLYVMDTISNPGAVTPSTTLTELEQLETQIEASEAIREATEDAREDAEDAREDAEAVRVGAENRREAAEDARDLAETQRSLNESGRQSVEAQRVSAESGRVTAETARVTAESGRVTAENARNTAEAGRAAAEEERESTFEQKAKLAQSWAVGGTGSRTGENTNNSKYFAENSAASAASSHEYAEDSRQSSEDSETYAGRAAVSAEAAQRSALSMAFVQFYMNALGEVIVRNSDILGTTSFRIDYTTGNFMVEI